MSRRLLAFLVLASLLPAGVAASGTTAEGELPSAPPEAGEGWFRTALAIAGAVLFLLLLIWNPGLALWLLFTILSGGKGGGYSGGGGGFRGSGGGRSGGGGASGSW